MNLVTRTLVGFVFTALCLLLPTPASSVQDGGSSWPPWTWPLDPTPPVVATFAPPDHVYGAGHRGVDVAGRPGQRVLAVAAGKVTFAGPVAGRGVVVVDHGRLRSTYQPVDTGVGVGDVVEAGQPIGRLTSAHSHCAPAACLHLGAKQGETYLDPLSLLGGRPVRLKPLDSASHAQGSLEATQPAAPQSSAGKPASAAAPSPLRRWVGLSALVAGGLLLLAPRAPRHQARG